MSNDPNINMPNYKQYGEAMYTNVKKVEPVLEQAFAPLPEWNNYSDDIVTNKSPVMFIGLGMAAAALIGATLFLAFSPSPIKEKMIEMKADVQVPAPVVVAPTPTPVVEAPTPTSVVVAALPVKSTLAPAELVLPRSEILSLLSKARTSISEGDISQARTYLERAAKTNDAIALLMLGETYDPETLKNMGARGIRADIARAKGLYEKALIMGEPQAKIRLEGLR